MLRKYNLSAEFSNTQRALDYTKPDRLPIPRSVTRNRKQHLSLGDRHFGRTIFNKIVAQNDVKQYEVPVVSLPLPIPNDAPCEKRVSCRPREFGARGGRKKNGVRSGIRRERDERHPSVRLIRSKPHYDLRARPGKPSISINTDREYHYPCRGGGPF